jgi:hypothetical protein
MGLKAIFKIMQQNVLPVYSYQVVCQCCKMILGKTYLPSQSRRLCQACKKLQEDATLKAPRVSQAGGGEEGEGQAA